MSKLKRKKKQIKKIASEELEVTTPIEEANKKGKQKREIEPLPKQYKAIVYTFFGIVLVGVITLILVLALRGNKEDDLPERYEDIKQISSNHYKALISSFNFDMAELEDEEKEVYDSFKNDLKNDIYIFVYNPDYDECPRCEQLEQFIKTIYNKENKDFTLLIMNYADNLNIFDYVDGNIEKAPALLYIKGDKLDQVYTTVNEIKYQLSDN